MMLMRKSLGMVLLLLTAVAVKAAAPILNHQQLTWPCPAKEPVVANV